MITNGGNYNPEAVYEQLTMVMYDNSTYITLKTVTGVTPSNDGINYILMAQGFNATALSAVTAVDTSGLLGSAGETISAQSLIDYLADAVSTKLLKKSDIATTLSSSDITVPASSLLKTTDDKIGDTSNLPVSTNNVVEAITQLNSNKADKNSDTSLSVKKIVGYSANDYRNAHFFAQSPTNENQNSRAGYGFENIGKNGAFLFLNTVQNMLSVIFNDNTTGNLLIDNAITSSDANQITITGFYRLGGGSANIPSWGGGVGILALKFNDMFIQLAFFNSDTPRFAIRNYYNGKWTAWAEK